MEWWHIPYSIILVVGVYAPAMYVLWTWPVTVEAPPGPDGGEDLPHPIPLPIPSHRRGDFFIHRGGD